MKWDGWQASDIERFFDRQAAGSHEIWYNEQTNKYTTIPNHPETYQKEPFAPSSERLASSLLIS
jgi:hypothetical protein